MTAAGPTGRIPDRLPLELIERIEAWRRAQPASPSMTRTLVYLLECGLAAVTSQKET